MGDFIVWLGIYTIVMITYPKFMVILTGSLLAISLFLVFGLDTIGGGSSRGMGALGAAAMAGLALIVIGLAFIISLIYYLVTRSIHKHLLFDISHDQNAFCFEKGRVKKTEPWNLLLDHSEGKLFADNPEVENKTKYGGIVDLGNIPFSLINEIPMTNYHAALPLDKLILGNSYAVKIAAEGKYAVLQFTNYNKEMKRIEFKWKSAKSESEH